MNYTRKDIKNPIILFDGLCNFCSGAVKYVIERDKKAKFRFAPLQSGAGKAIMEKYGIENGDFDSFILIENGKVYMRSTAALRVQRLLGGFWKFLYVFIVIPVPIRDAVYDFLARNRYKWFGKKDECMVPGPDVRSRFLE